MSSRRFAIIFAATMALPAAGCTNLTSIQGLNARTPEEAQSRTKVLSPIATSDGRDLPCAVYAAAEQDICLRRDGNVAISWDNEHGAATEQAVEAVRAGSKVAAGAAAVGTFILAK